MKVIVAGATGFIGSEVVRRCVADERIDHIFVLVRKPLADAAVAKSPKVTVITHQDFSSYPPELLDRLTGAEGCIWCLGGRAPQFPDAATYRRVQIDYTLAAARAFSSALGPNFRFVFCSGSTAEWDPEKPLLYWADTRRVKGQVEKGLCDMADADADRLGVWCARPSAVLARDAGVMLRTAGKLVSAIGVDRLAEGLVELFAVGHRDRIIENDVLLRGLGGDN